MQILTFTYPEIGNTGINFDDSESNTTVKELLCVIILQIIIIGGQQRI